MSRLTIPSSIDASPEGSRASLGAVAKALGSVPNLFRLVGNSPAALKGYLGLNSALTASTLDPKTQERIALVVAELNGCDYCLSAHTYLGRNVAGLDDAEITANRNGSSNDVRAAAAVHFAAQIVRSRGHAGDADVQAVKAAGFADAEIVEIVVAVALNTFTNYINEVAQTEIDFPVVHAIPAVAGLSRDRGLGQI
jgi:uncharacterized peroxidase-related enzyme